MDEPTKRCAHCGETKPYSAFYAHKRYTYNDNGSVDKWPGKPTAYCKPCDMERQRDRRKARQAAKASRPPITPVPALWAPGAPVNVRGTASHRYYRATQELLNAKRRTDPQT